MTYKFDQDFARVEQLTKPESPAASGALMTRGDLELVKRLTTAMSSHSPDLAKFELVDGDKTVAGSPAGSNSGVEERARVARATEQKKDLPHVYNPNTDSGTQSNPDGSRPDEIRIVKPSVYENPADRNDHPLFGEPIHLKPMGDPFANPKYEPLPIDLKPLPEEKSPFYRRHHEPLPITIQPYGEPLPSFDKPLIPYERPDYDDEPLKPLRVGKHRRPDYDDEPFKPWNLEKPSRYEGVALIDWPQEFKPNRPDGSMQVVDENGVKTYWPNGSVNVKNFDGTGYFYNPPKDGNSQAQYKHWGPKPEDNYSDEVIVLPTRDMKTAAVDPEIAKLLKAIQLQNEDPLACDFTQNA